jgi:hypothetical protein
MATLTSYTTYDEIRAALGVSATEITDLVLARPVYDILLETDLEAVNANIPSLYATISALPSLSRTTAQQRFYDLVRLFACYSLAKTLLSSLPFFAVERLTDGRAEFQRQKDLFGDVRQSIDGIYNTVRLRLSQAQLAVTPLETPYVTTAYDYVVATGLALDPVTNA